MKRTIMLLLLITITHSISQNIRTIYLSELSNTKYECADPSCSSSIVTFTVNLMNCQINCLSYNNCRTATFNQFNKQCELFPDIPSQYGNMVTQTGIVTMTAVDDRKLSARKSN